MVLGKALLKNIAGVINQQKENLGQGSMVPLLEMGAGFDPDYTGRKHFS